MASARCWQGAHGWMPTLDVRRLTASPRPTSWRMSTGTWIRTGRDSLGSFIIVHRSVVTAPREVTPVSLLTGGAKPASLVRRAVLAGDRAAGGVVRWGRRTTAFAARQRDGSVGSAGGRAPRLERGDECPGDGGLAHWRRRLGQDHLFTSLDGVALSSSNGPRTHRTHGHGHHVGHVHGVAVDLARRLWCTFRVEEHE